MTTTTAPTSGSPPLGDHAALAHLRPPRAAAVTAFGALLLRDFLVLRKTLGTFLSRTLIQPFLIVFVFTRVFPKIGQGIGGTGARAAAFSSLLVPGVVGIATLLQGIQAVALPLALEFGYTREIEDRVMAPLPVWGVAVEKIVAGAIQALLAALVVFPMAWVVPATPVHLSISWPILVLALPLACLLSASLGLAIGTSIEPRQISLVFSIVVLPITFLGATYYPWASLTPIAWLKWLVLINPLVYMSEGYRAAITSGFPHMPLLGVFGGMLAFTAVLLTLGIKGFAKRVLT
jgi:ABC-2 type transport system permease protein